MLGKLSQSTHLMLIPRLDNGKLSIFSVEKFEFILTEQVKFQASIELTKKQDFRWSHHKYRNHLFVT